MKISLTISFVILLFAGIFGLRNHQALAAADSVLRETINQARSLGVPLDPSGGLRPRSRHHQRTLPATDVKSLAAGLIKLARDSEIEPKGVPTEDEQRVLDRQRQLLALDALRMKELVAEINLAVGIEDETHQEIIALVFQAFVESHPRAALDFLAENPDILKNSRARAGIAVTGLVHCMESDPDAAISWYRDQRGLFAGSDGDTVIGGLLSGTALLNPKLAFSLISTLELPNIEYAVGTIVHRARTPAQRDAALAAFRDYLKILPASADREAIVFEGNSSILRNSFYDGFENGTRWIENAGFSQQELETFADRIHFISPEDSGKYLDWLIRFVHTEKIASEIVPQQFFSWVGADYQAAGRWLEAAPEGPAKTAAAATYARTLSPYHPETAAQWALTLPPGQDRDQILPQIYKSWSKTDPAAAAAFADHNGIAR